MAESPSTYIFLLNPQNSALKASLSLSEEGNPGVGGSHGLPEGTRLVSGKRRT